VFFTNKPRLLDDTLGAQYQNERNTDYGGFTELVAIEKNLRGYNSDLVLKMSKYCKEGSVLELGAGIGTLAIEWEKRTGVKPECLEVDDRQRRMIRERGFVCYKSIDEIKKKFDAIYSPNVFEHIEDDVKVLKEVSTIMTEGAILAVYVPAFMCLFSDIDRALGHYRRYHKAELIQKAKGAGLKVVDCHYADSLGFFAWFAMKLFGNKTLANFRNTANLRFYDKWLYPLSTKIDALCMKRLIGKNLILIAQK